jgi:hypothetical protein
MEAYKVVERLGEINSEDNRLSDGSEVVSLPRRLRFNPQTRGRFLVLISVRSRVNPRAIVRLEGSRLASS